MQQWQPCLDSVKVLVGRNIGQQVLIDRWRSVATISVISFFVPVAPEGVICVLLPLDPQPWLMTL